MKLDHAFAGGPVFARSKAVAPGWLEKLLRAKCGSFVHFRRTAFEVWSNFEACGQIDASCKLGPGAFCLSENKRVTLCRNVICRGILRCELFGHGEIVIGEDVYIGDDVIVSAAHSVRIGARTLIAQGVEIFDNDTHPLDPGERRRDYQFILGREKEKPPVPAAPVEIGEDCWIGSGAFIAKGVRIGAGGVVAARSVVTRDVPARTLVAGNPAREIRALGA
jgi:acetyltransferase-like isoleucine patch superfamily enzyme